MDFTQAFNSGEEKEIYASQPADSPLPGYLPRQLLRLKKTCYGLLDGPYAWYQHLKKVLIQLGYQCSSARPYLFYLFDQDQQLQGVISVATDDLQAGQVYFRERTICREGDCLQAGWKHSCPPARSTHKRFSRSSSSHHGRNRNMPFATRKRSPS